MIAFLRGEPAAEDVAELLREPTALSAANYAEIIDHIIRIAGLDEDEAAIRIQLLAEAGMRAVPVDERIASRAGALRARHYDRRLCAISLADCCALATGLEWGAPLATSDPALAAVARAEGCAVIGLPETRGTRP